MTVPSSVKDITHVKHLYIARGNANGTTILENILAVSYKSNIHLPSDSAVLLNICA